MKVAIIGLGKSGSIHTRIYKEIPQVQIVGLSDIDESRIINTKQSLSIETFSTNNYQELLKLEPDAVSIATPTSSHFEIANFFLSRNIPCLVEKPITSDVTQAKKLFKIAKKNKVTLMVGQVERFNSAISEVKKIISQPKFIECDRLSPYPHRSIDISVVLDLMIHDLDIILSLVNQKIKTIQAIGVNVISKSTDIANVRINFNKGCVANISTSRISQDTLRKIRIFQPNSYISLDYAKQEAEIFQKTENAITKNNIPIPKQEPLKREIITFLEEIKNKKPDFTHTKTAIDALDLAIRIEKLIAKQKNKS